MTTPAVRRPYEAVVTDVAEEAASRLLTLWRELPASEFRAVAVRVLLSYQGNARIVAWQWFARLMLEETGQLATDIPTSAPQSAHLLSAVETCIAVAETAEVKLARLAIGEVTEAASSEVAELVRKTDACVGWTRELDSKACELCRWWWREGRVWPDDHPMPRHVGCACAQRPAWSEAIESTGYTRGERRAVERVTERVQREREREQ